MYSKHILPLFLVSAFQSFVRAQGQGQGQMPPEIQNLSSECKQALQNPQGSPECSPQAVMTGGTAMLETMCKNRERCAEENRKAIRKGCAADANSPVIKAMLGPHLELSLESACIKDKSGSFCALKAQTATSEQHAKQLMCGDCHEKLLAVMMKGAGQAQEGEAQLKQAIQKMSQFCGGGRNLRKRAEQANFTITAPSLKMVSGATISPAISFGSIALLVSLCAALLIPF
jgi:hypothetical protein